jgi:hypothetical protein
MLDLAQVEEAFTRIINNGPGADLKKAAKKFWDAHQSGEGVDEAIGLELEKSISTISLDYRNPALQCLENCVTSKKTDDNSTDCYFELARCLSKRIVHTM